MKNQITLLLLLAGLVFQQTALAGTFIIKGTVTDESKRPLAGKVIYISSESGSSGCIFQRKVITNNNGYYIDSLTCSADFAFIQVQTTDCNGRPYIHRMVPGSQRVIESNFVMCGTSSLVACKAAFTYSPYSASITTSTSNYPFVLLFTSASSETVPGDSIVSRTWSFGDRTQLLTGNEPIIRHAFPGPGTYQVTLSIKTARGCESKTTTSVIVKEQPCTVNTKVFIQRQTDRYFQFSSVQDNLAPGDTIIKRIWSFGDGSVLDGNEISPVKKYSDTGSYKICLQFKTKFGCNGEACLSIKVKDSLFVNASCKALFTVQSEGLTTFVNSNVASAGIYNNGRKDSIISRSWYINDSLQGPFTTSNPIDFRKTFIKAGTYNITLVIKTAGGCESKYVQTITLQAQNCNLSTKALVAKNNGLQYVFNRLFTNNIPGDSIISTSWKFGDGTTLEGNQESPYKVYQQSGKYTVCVVSKTKYGCVSEACITIEAKDSVIVPTDCKAYFTYEINNGVLQLNSASSKSSSGGIGTQSDSIISRTWVLADTAKYTVAGSRTDFSYSFAKSGTYTVLLYIKTRLGCESKYAASVVIPPVVCRFDAKIETGRFVGLVRDFKNATNTLPSGDSIVKRTWKFGNGTTLDGNNPNPTITYSKPGKYTVCLIAESVKGCISENCIDIIVSDSLPTATNCKAAFGYSINSNIVYFNSRESAASINSANTVGFDSIVSRTWYFGDNASGSAGLTGNEIETKHEYLQPGTYTVYLVIKTKLGCESKFSVTFTIAGSQSACKAVADFKFETAGGLKVQFASGASSAGTSNDSLVSRIWSFGDNTVLTGNVINPLKEFRIPGSYKTCLQVKTASGCKSEICKDIRIADTANTSPISITYLSIIAINPNPVQTKMAVTVYSKLPDINSEFTIYDLNGNPKMSFKKSLTQGNNILEIYAGQLSPGLYFLKVANAYGKDSMQFYKQ
ncbi:MAG: PKD domain-containing protein [Chitinophagia bacterium]|jgi:PKD repeat protein